MRLEDKISIVNDIEFARTADLDIHTEVIQEFRQKLLDTRHVFDQPKEDQNEIKSSTLDLSFRWYLDDEIENSLAFWSNNYKDQYLIGLIDEKAMNELSNMVGFHQSSRYGFEIEGSNTMETFLSINKIATDACKDFESFMSARKIHYSRMFSFVKHLLEIKGDQTSVFNRYFHDKKHSTLRNIDKNTIEGLRPLMG